MCNRGRWSRSIARTRCAATSTIRVSPGSRGRFTSGSTSRPNETPVYAVRRGVVHLEGARSLSVADGELDFGYWHVIPAVRHHERVAKREVLGHVEARWLRLHFAEHRNEIYRDPLRPGALSPWQDTTAPLVTRIVLSRNGRVLSPAAVSGAAM